MRPGSNFLDARFDQNTSTIVKVNECAWEKERGHPPRGASWGRDIERQVGRAAHSLEQFPQCRTAGEVQIWKAATNIQNVKAREDEGY